MNRRTTFSRGTLLLAVLCCPIVSACRAKEHAPAVDAGAAAASVTLVASASASASGEPVGAPLTPMSDPFAGSTVACEAGSKSSRAKRLCVRTAARSNVDPGAKRAKQDGPDLGPDPAPVGTEVVLFVQGSECSTGCWAASGYGNRIEVRPVGAPVHAWTVEGRFCHNPRTFQTADSCECGERTRFSLGRLAAGSYAVSIAGVTTLHFAIPAVFDERGTCAGP